MTFYDNDGGLDYYVGKVPADINGIQINGIKDDGSGVRDQSPDITSGWYDGVAYYMHWDGGNKVSSFDISDVKFPCKHSKQEAVPGSDATCTEDGLSEGIKCTDCGEILEEQEVITAKGHDYKTEVTEPEATESTEPPRLDEDELPAIPIV